MSCQQALGCSTRPGRSRRSLSGKADLSHRLQDHHRDTTVSGALCVVVAGRVHRYVQLPQPLAFVALSLRSIHFVTLTAKDHAALRIGLEVVVPGRIALLSVVGGDEDESIPV